MRHIITVLAILIYFPAMSQKDPGAGYMGRKYYIQVEGILAGEFVPSYSVHGFYPSYKAQFRRVFKENFDFGISYKYTGKTFNSYDLNYRNELIDNPKLAVSTIGVSGRWYKKKKSALAPLGWYVDAGLGMYNSTFTSPHYKDATGTIILSKKAKGSGVAFNLGFGYQRLYGNHILLGASTNLGYANSSEFSKDIDPEGAYKSAMLWSNLLSGSFTLGYLF